MEDNPGKKDYAAGAKSVHDPLTGSGSSAECRKSEEGPRGESFPPSSAAPHRTDCEYVGCSRAAGGGSDAADGANARDFFGGETVRVACGCGCGSYPLARANDSSWPTETRIGGPRKARTTPVMLLPRMAPVFVLACLLTLQHGRPTYAAFTTVTTVPDPEFLDQIGNITVPAGRNVKLACSVKDLGLFKVAWMLFDKSAILTVQNHVITRNPRISVSHDKHRTWFLHINDVHEDDRGKYMCQINTASAKTQYGYLHVVVPPNIDDSQSSSDAIVRENSNLSLTCKATGSPTPSIRWKRDDGSKIVINKNHSVLEWEGDTLEMWQISRLSMGAYLCIASNGIPPTVSKQIKVSVDFSPGVQIPHQLVGVPLGFMVNLECFIEAHPTSLNYWTRENDTMIYDSTKYKATSVPLKPSYKAHMTLTIFNVQKEDYGTYKCVAKNPRGGTDGTIRLYMSPPPSTSPSPTTTELVKKDWDLMTELNNSVYGNPSSLTIHNEKKVKSGNKYQSNLNEIGKSEQKSTELDKTRHYNWRPDNDLATNITTTGMLLAMCLIVSTIIR